MSVIAWLLIVAAAAFLAGVLVLLAGLIAGLGVLPLALWLIGGGTLGTFALLALTVCMVGDED